MLRLVAIDLLAGAVLMALWYLWFTRVNRKRCAEVLRWINAAFQGRGQISSLKWIGMSRFNVRLRLTPGVFQNASATVQLIPRELPFHWLISRLKKKQETLTFEADLDYAPTFNLQVQNHRWCGRTRKKLNPGGNDWTTERTGAFVLTTRTDWQREITTMMNSLVASRECDCLSVSFRRTSPHFSAIVPLQSISPQSQRESQIFDVLRELAAGASASRF
jgi:hypothetical protein